ncbi:MAG: Methionyl-tRNA formyltransferase [Parcubacteria group bacterium Gr01-1014_13]|nr:MAG: Methionyl-tRNA formyltransferase [Parcubacteria group bacterium Gr01-1014_13]
MQKVKTVFFGTQDFAATILQGLLDSDIVSIEMVFTQPDRKTGRKQIIEESPVKKLAKKYNIKIEQPETLKNSEIDLSGFELGIVAQYGLIIPKKIIDSFPKGMINVHGSLLPKYRGASPIQAALINGEKETGVTIMVMDEKMDHGPILSQKSILVDPNDTYTTLASKMAVEGQILLLNTLPDWLNDTLKAQPQDESQATFTKLLAKEDGLVDFHKTNDEIYNQYRGLSPWPGVWCMRNDKRLKLLKISKSGKTLPVGEAMVENKRIFIGCSKGSIEILELQLEGKAAMDASTFLNGYKV